MLSKKAIEEFKKIWEAEFGIAIPDELAAEKAADLLVLFDNIYRPLKNNWLSK